MFARCCAVSRITFGRVKLQRNRIIPIIVTMMLGDNSDFSICLKFGLPPFIIITPCVHEQILNIVTYAVRQNTPSVPYTPCISGMPIKAQFE